MAEPQTFNLSYEWQVNGPIEAVYYFLSHLATYPEWWPVFRSVEVPPGEPNIGVASKADVKAILPYYLDWTITPRILEPPRLVVVVTHLVISGGLAVDGYVRFELEQGGESVIVHNIQEERLGRPLPRIVRPIAERVFRFNHDWAMAQGLPGLQRVVSEVASGARTLPARSP
jgi:uncharacterized membrane protein